MSLIAVQVKWQLYRLCVWWHFIVLRWLNCLLSANCANNTFFSQDPTFKPCQMKTHFVLPFPVNYIGECIRTVPYTATDYARQEAESAGSFVCVSGNAKQNRTAENGVSIKKKKMLCGVFVTNSLQTNLHVARSINALFCQVLRLSNQGLLTPSFQITALLTWMCLR